MKTFSLIAKIVTALAAIAGVVYIVATYGDKIVAWAKKLLASCPCAKNECEIVEEDFAEEAPMEPAEEAPAQEPAPVEEVPAEEVVIEESEPVADEADFEG